MKNKKLLIIVAAVVVVLAVVLAVVLLGGNKAPETTTTSGQGSTPATQTYKLGMGAVAGSHTSSQTNLTVATVVLDEAGKIVACRLDVAQNKYAFDEDEEELTFKVLKTKMELKEAYNMKGASPIGKEWYEQAQAFEAWVEGKTGAEVAELLKKDNLVQNGTHWVTTDEVLKVGCTMDVQDFRDAVVKACNDEQGVKFTTDKAFTLGLGINSADDGSSAEDEENYKVQLNVEFAGTVVIDGKVFATVNDAYQPHVIVEDGEVVKATVGTFDKDGVEDQGFMTKRELKETYGMKVAAVDKNGDGVSLEWYLQSAAYSKLAVGMTAAELAGYFAANDELLEADCTIYIGGISTVVAESVTNAR